MPGGLSASNSAVWLAVISDGGEGDDGGAVPAAALLDENSIALTDENDDNLLDENG